MSLACSRHSVGSEGTLWVYSSEFVAGEGNGEFETLRDPCLKIRDRDFFRFYQIRARDFTSKKSEPETPIARKCRANSTKTA